jgi:hypothetical protein
MPAVPADVSRSCVCAGDTDNTISRLFGAGLEVKHAAAEVNDWYHSLPNGMLHQVLNLLSDLTVDDASLREAEELISVDGDEAPLRSDEMASWECSKLIRVLTFVRDAVNFAAITHDGIDETAFPFVQALISDTLSVICTRTVLRFIYEFPLESFTGSGILNHFWTAAFATPDGDPRQQFVDFLAYCVVQTDCVFQRNCVVQPEWTEKVIDVLAMLATDVGKVLYPGEDDFHCLWHAADHLYTQDTSSSWTAARIDTIASVRKAMHNLHLGPGYEMKVVKALSTVTRRLQGSPPEQQILRSVFESFRNMTRATAPPPPRHPVAGVTDGRHAMRCDAMRFDAMRGHCKLTVRLFITCKAVCVQERPLVRPLLRARLVLLHLRLKLALVRPLRARLLLLRLRLKRPQLMVGTRQYLARVH